MDINTYFDKIIIVNLDKRVDRWNKLLPKLQKNNITNYIKISAVDPTIPPYNNLKLPNNFYDTIGAYGMLCSAYLVILHAKRNNYKRILLLEDDILFHKKFNSHFSKKIGSIPDWYLLYFGTSIHQWRFKDRCKINGDYMQSKGTIAGAFGIGIDSRVYDILLQQILTMNQSWDIGPLKLINQLYPNKCFIFNPYLIIANTEDSNIRDGKTLNYKASQCNWDLNLYEI